MGEIVAAEEVIVGVRRARREVRESRVRKRGCERDV